MGSPASEHKGSKAGLLSAGNLVITGEGLGSMAQQRGRAKASPARSKREVVTHSSIMDSNTTKVTALVPLSIMNISGDEVVRLELRATDRVSAIKERIRAAEGTPVYQQQILWGEQLLLSNQVLQDLNVPTNGEPTELHLVVNGGPGEEEIERARAAVCAAQVAMKPVTSRAVLELKSLGRPPECCLHIMCALLHVFAGRRPDVVATAEISWETARTILDRSFLASADKLLKSLDEEPLSEASVQGARACLARIPGDTPDDQRQLLNRCSMAATGMFGWLTNVLEFHAVSKEVADRLGGLVPLRAIAEGGPAA